MKKVLTYRFTCSKIIKNIKTLIGTVNVNGILQRVDEGGSPQISHVENHPGVVS